MAKLRLLPRDERFFDLFERAAQTGVAGAEVLQRMLVDIENGEDYRQEMSDLEHQGDAIIHEVMDKLNRTFVTPFDPEDIRALASRLDDIIDFTQAAVERVVLYHVTKTHPYCGKLADVLVQCTREVHSVVGKLRDISERRVIMEQCIEINRLENSGDRIYREAMGELFRNGDVMELLRWKEIYEQVEQAIDECENLADVIESLLVKHS